MSLNIIQTVQKLDNKNWFTDKLHLLFIISVFFTFAIYKIVFLQYWAVHPEIRYLGYCFLF